MTDIIRIVLVDDHPIVRRGLQQMMEMDGLTRVVGQANNAAVLSK